MGCESGRDHLSVIAVATTSEWIAGARPRTLPAAIVPVAVGTATAHFVGSPLSVASFWLRAALALVVSLALQVGVNYANDYSDGIKGTDDVRVGPVRLVGQGLAPAEQVKKAAYLCFAVACVAGLILVLLTGAWWMIAVGVAAVLAAWFYTGGSRPYGYAGLGEVMVFIFFGLVAVMGTTFVLVGRIPLLSFLLAIPVGLLACALLIINNLRDIPTDSQVGKRTLAVRLGDHKTRELYGLCLFLPFLFAIVIGFGGFGFIDMFPAGALIAVLPLPLAFIPWRTVTSGATGPALIPVLGGTGRIQLLYGLLLALGVALSA